MITTQREKVRTAEDTFRRQLRDKLVAIIEAEGLDTHDVARIVGMLPSGAHALMRRKDWSLTTCLRVAESLGVEVRPTLAGRDRRGS